MTAGTLTRELPDGTSQKIFVQLSPGGDQFPWATDGEKIYVGLPSPGDRNPEGVLLSDLEWRVTPHLVLDARFENGEETDLTPQEWFQVLRIEE